MLSRRHLPCVGLEPRWQALTGIANIAHTLTGTTIRRHVIVLASRQNAARQHNRVGAALLKWARRPASSASELVRIPPKKPPQYECRTRRGGRSRSDSRLRSGASRSLTGSALRTVVTCAAGKNAEPRRKRGILHSRLGAPGWLKVRLTQPIVVLIDGGARDRRGFGGE
jgi:hypothetical protein